MPAYKMEYVNKFRPGSLLIERCKILLHEAMAKVKHQVLAILLTLFSCHAAIAQYQVNYTYVDSVNRTSLLETNFKDHNAAKNYISGLPVLLQSHGYITASVDSVFYDSTSAIVNIYLGNQYKWATLYTSPGDADLLEAVRWNQQSFYGSKIDFRVISHLNLQILDYLEEHGHPFAKIFLDSIAFMAEEVSAALKIERGPLYIIDSIRVYGDVKIDNEFLQRYLDIFNGSRYNKKKLAQVDKKISDLIFMQTEHPSNLSLLGSGAVLNLYLKQRKNNQVNVLLGLLPNSGSADTKKFHITGEANILLRNSLGAGETMGLNWQQLQLSSPRLNILFSQPYFLQSKFGLDVNFNMLRKDTTYLNLDFRLGTNYRSGNKVASIFFQRRATIVNGINASAVISARKLPAEADVSSNNLGLSYEFNSTDYRYNPRKGNELLLTTLTGKKTIKKNTQVTELKDPSNPGFNFERLYDTVKLKAFQVRATVSAAHYFPFAKLSTVKTAVNAGLYQSNNIFRNELFQVGGYKLLRGFEEESEYLSQYAIATIEYRFLLSRNSNFFTFIDGGFGRSARTHNYISTGVGVSFETKAGLINLAIATGKRDDTKFNLRQTKLHIGFTSYF
jgi:outer membrane protein assembly factor BamA